MSYHRDHLSIMRIIGNLMKNAIYYGKDGKTIGVELLEADAEYELHIWDQGPGIPKHDLQNVFERMYRSEQSRNSSFGGSGLGLSISKALVEKMVGIYGLKVLHGNELLLAFLFQNTILLRNS